MVFLPDMLPQHVGGGNDGIAPGGVVPTQEDTHGIAEPVLHVFLLQIEVGEGGVDGDVPLFVFQSGGADFLCGADELGKHASAVPFAERGTVDDVKRLKSQNLLAEVEESHQLAVIDERAGDIPFGIGPERVQIWIELLHTAAVV